MEQTIFTGSKLINGNDIYYEFYPHDQPKDTVLLIHGFLSSSFSFRRLIPLLRREYNVISIDLPPFGKSGKSLNFTYSYENLAKSVIEFLRIMGFEKVHLIGHSMGGQISLNILHLYPSMVNKAILLCSSGYLQRSKRHLLLSSRIPFFHIYVKYHLARSGVLNNLKKVVHDQKMIDDEMILGYTSPFLEDDIFKALTRMIRDREGDLTAEKLNSIETPCLLIWGEHDRVVPLNVGKRLNKDLKNSDLIVFKDTGHLVPEERPEDTTKYIREFIAE
ncbi:alpha/beta fold hydrolase [Cytobacillus sp. FJAT-54145]|uniref:Alpha/beta fold hydrolase n=1 Tax=Cytobacillus spartinae TaxID=3299023 RepID=A0ABW6KE10_9BACI